MDIASGCRRVIAMTQHTTKKGKHKLVARGNYPLTATAIVPLVITEFGVFEPTGTAFRVVEFATTSPARSPPPPGAPLAD